MRSKAIRLAATVGAVGLALTACGSTGGSSSSPTTAKSASSLSAADLSEMASYTHSKLGAASPSATPFVIGYVNQQGGATSFPEYTTDVEALVKIINSKLDGVGGHPIKLDQCYVVSSDSEGQSCGQQFAADHSLRAVLEFPLINGGAAFHQVMDATKTPIFGPIAASTNDASGPYSFFDTAAALTTTPIIVKYVSQVLKAKSVAVVGIQGNALSQLTTAATVQAFNAVKIPAKLALISSASSDAIAPLVAAGAQKAGAIVSLVADATQCDTVATTLKSLSLGPKPVVTLDICADPAVKSALGDYPKWTYLSGWPSLNVKPIDTREASEISVVRDFFHSIGSPTIDFPYVEPSTQGILVALREINSGGGTSATSASIVKAAKGDKGPMFLGPDSVAWDKIPGLTAVPSLSQRIFSYTGSGVWKDDVNGWYTAPAAPPGGKPPSGAPPAG
jgi:branched-chain amino acid transport system substrate-binding protein